MRKGLRNTMGHLHEVFLVSMFGGRKTRGSGSQWKDQMDGRHNRMSRRFAFAWDGKSTLARSVSVTRDMWHKAVEQAGGERPMLALRFYDNERLDVGKDLVVLDLNDFVELLEAANEQLRLEPARIFCWRDARITVMIYDGKVSFPQRVELVQGLEGAVVRIYDREIDPVEVYVDGELVHSSSVLSHLVNQQMYFPEMPTYFPPADQE